MYASVLPTGGFGVYDNNKYEVITNKKVYIYSIVVMYSEELKKTKQYPFLPKKTK